MTKKLIKKALDLYEQGFQPIPTKYKTPVIEGWQDSQEVPNGNFEKPGVNSIGIVMGRKVEDGYLVALDVDCYNADVSRDFYVWLAEKYGKIPYRVGTKPKFLVPFICTDYQVVKTSTDYYENKSRVELLGLGQQFVAYGFPSPGVAYTWHNGELDMTTIPRWSVEDVNGIIGMWRQFADKAGMRINVAGEVFDDPFENDADEDFMRDVVKPPLDLSLDQVKDTLRRYRAEGLDYDRWLEVGMALFHQFEGSQAGYDLWWKWSKASSKFDDSKMARKWSSFDRDSGPTLTFATVMARAKAVTPLESPTSTKERFVSPSALTQRIEGAPWLIKKMIERDSLCVLYGASGTGKSYLALHMAVAVAHGEPFAGHLCHGAPVAYMYGEGHRGVSHRLHAMAIDADRELSDDTLKLSGRIINFSSVDDVKAVITELKSIKPGLVIIDTLARATAGMDENSATDMGAVVKACDAIRRILHCCVMIVHHTGVGDQHRARGSSVLRAAADTEIRLEHNGEDGIVVKSTKSKDAEPFSNLGFTFKRINFGIYDNDGDELYSHVLSFDEDADTTIGRQRPLRGHALTLYDCFKKLWRRNTHRVPAPADLIQDMGLEAITEGIPLGVVRDDFMRTQPSTDTATQLRGRFRDALKSCVNNGYLLSLDDIIMDLS